jgi:hypothetical protein
MDPLTRRERSVLVWELSIYDRQEAEALVEIQSLEEIGGAHCARAVVADMIGDNAMADFHHGIGWKLLDDAKQKQANLVRLREMMARTEEELAAR